MRVSIPVLGALLLAGADARCIKVTPSASSASAIAATSSGSVAKASSSAQSPAASSSAAGSTTTTKAGVEIPSSSAAAAASKTASSSKSAAKASSASTTAVTSVAASSSAATAVVTSIPSSSSSIVVVSSSTAASTTKAPAATNYPRAYPADVVDKLRDSSFAKLETYAQANLAGGACTLETASIRREWSDLSVEEREAYTSAVMCLQKLPSKSDPKEVPGARNRFDDFMAVHMVMTPWVHNSANFLAWHRYYVFTYEKALKEECGYTGSQPYWNWDRYAADPAHSPLFSGNSSSLGGNSLNGECASVGPLADFKVNLGPGTSLNYNPRCLRRGINKGSASDCTADKTYSLITRSSSISAFQNTMQGVPGVHVGGHFTIGGDPGGDINSSPGDPGFYAHHAMIDRVWWLWQLQDLETRLETVAGMDLKTSRPGSVKDTVDLGILNKKVALGELLNTLGGNGGEFCYIYM